MPPSIAQRIPLRDLLVGAARMIDTQLNERARSNAARAVAVDRGRARDREETWRALEHHAALRALPAPRRPA